MDGGKSKFSDRSDRNAENTTKLTRKSDKSIALWNKYCGGAFSWEGVQTTA